jgi:hypothetical protein
VSYSLILPFFIIKEFLMKKNLLVLVLSVSFLIPSTSLNAKPSTMVSQMCAGMALGTGMGLTLGLLNKHYPQYNHTSSLVASIAHSALLTDLHKEMNAPGISLDLSSFVSAMAVYICINRSAICSHSSMQTQSL